MQTHRGRIKLADGDEVDVDLEMTDESIRLATDATEIGTWARAEFHIVPLGEGVFEIVIDGDRVAFEPLEVEPFEVSMLSSNGVDPDHLARQSAGENFRDGTDPEPADEAAPELGATQSGDPNPADADAVPVLQAVERGEEGQERSFDEGSTNIIDSVDPGDGDAGSPDAASGDSTHRPEAFDPDDERLDLVDGLAGSVGGAPEGEFDLGGHHDSAEMPGEVEHPTTDRDGMDAIDTGGGWTGSDVFLEDPEGAAGLPIEGDEVTTWTLVTADDRVEGNRGQHDGAGEIVSTVSRLEGATDHGLTQPEERWDEPEVRPEWPGLGYELVEGSDAVGGLPVPASDQPRSDDMAAGDQATDDPDTVEGAIPIGFDAPTAHGASADPPSLPNDDESAAPGATTGWNYEVLARALAELEQSPGTEGEAVEPQSEAVPPADQGESGGGRFGGSSVERLSAAVGSLRGRPKTPAEEALAEARGEDSEGAGSVADGILASQRSLRQATVVQKITWDLVRKVGAGVLLGIGIAAVVVLAPDAWDVLTREPDTPVTTVDPGEVDPTTVTTTVTAESSTTTTLAPESSSSTTTTTPVPTDTVFDLPAPQFVRAWNDAAGPIDDVLTFAALPPIGEFENEFFSHLSMLGVVGPDGTVDAFSLVIDPTGPANSDRLGIQSLGVALKVIDTDSTGSSRSALLRSLGLDVSEPNLAGIDSSLDVDGIRYSLRYDSESVTLTLSVAPIGPGGE